MNSTAIDQHCDMNRRGSVSEEEQYQKGDKTRRNSIIKNNSSTNSNNNNNNNNNRGKGHSISKRRSIRRSMRINTPYCAVYQTRQDSSI